MQKSDIENVETRNSEIELHDDQPKSNVIDLIANSQFASPKSPVEKSLLRKADSVIIPLAAICYFVAYLVCPRRP
jgi:hypothetical protein